MLPPGGTRLPAVLRNKRPAPARSASPSSTSGPSDDSDDGITTPRSGTSSLFRPEEDDEHGDDSDGTPSEPRPSAHRAVERGGVVKRKKKRKEKKRTKADRERDSASRLSLPPPRRSVLILWDHCSPQLPRQPRPAPRSRLSPPRRQAAPHQPGRRVDRRAPAASSSRTRRDRAAQPVAAAGGPRGRARRRGRRRAGRSMAAWRRALGPLASWLAGRLAAGL